MTALDLSDLSAILNRAGELARVATDPGNANAATDALVSLALTSYAAGLREQTGAAASSLSLAIKMESLATGWELAADLLAADTVDEASEGEQMAVDVLREHAGQIRTLIRPDVRFDPATAPLGCVVARPDPTDLRRWVRLSNGLARPWLLCDILVVTPSRVRTVSDHEIPADVVPLGPAS